MRALSTNYGDLNALHPFIEGNGRAQREFARMVCLECGYDFNLSCTTHQEMLQASILSFNKADSSLFIEIFTKAIVLCNSKPDQEYEVLNILTSDDLTIDEFEKYKYDYFDNNYELLKQYDTIYEARIREMEK